MHVSHQDDSPAACVHSSDAICNVHRSVLIISRTFSIYLVVGLIVRSTTDYEKPEPSKSASFYSIKPAKKTREVSGISIKISAALLFPSNLGLEMACNHKHADQQSKLGT